MDLCLSIDGGGVKGIIQTIVLSELEQELNTPLYEIFDSYAGTSIGSVITSSIGVCKNSMDEVVKLMDPNKISQIFMEWRELFALPFQRPSYSGVGKSKLLHELFGEIKMCNTDKIVIAPAFDLCQNKSIMFNSTNCYNYPLWKILDGCTAAPTFFPSVELPDGKVIIDAGGSVNDPSMCLFIEMVKLGKKNCKILSIGNGINPPSIKPCNKKYNGLFDWVSTGDLINVLTDTSIIDHQCENMLGKNYLRINNELSFGADPKLDNCNPNNLEALHKNGKYWWEINKPKIMKFLIN